MHFLQVDSVGRKLISQQDENAVLDLIRDKRHSYREIALLSRKEWTSLWFENFWRTAKKFKKLKKWRLAGSICLFEDWSVGVLKVI